VELIFLEVVAFNNLMLEFAEAQRVSAGMRSRMKQTLIVLAVALCICIFGKVSDLSSNEIAAAKTHNKITVDRAFELYMSDMNAAFEERKILTEDALSAIHKATKFKAETYLKQNAHRFTIPFINAEDILEPFSSLLRQVIAKRFY